MAQPLDGVLSQAQRDSLEIDEFIFHIIDPDAKEDKVVYMDEVKLQPRQKKFFLDRLKEMAEGTQYLFKQDAVHLKEKCEQLIEDRKNFVEISRQITEDFSGRHQGQMSAGVFIVSVVKYLISSNQWHYLTFLIKMDKQPSITYSYKEENGKKIAIVEEIQNSLNESKNAIQKSALLDVSEQFKWNVLAFDRVQKPRLSDYFKAFLGVVERHQDSELTRMAHTAVRKWARKLIPEQMPENEDSTTYSGRSLNYLSDHDTFNTEAFLDAVVRDQDAERKRELTESLRAGLIEAGVSGQRFSPRPDSIPGKDKKETYLTDEGVTIVFQGDKKAAGINIERFADGKVRIIIETNNLKIK